MLNSRKFQVFAALIGFLVSTTLSQEGAWATPYACKLDVLDGRYTVFQNLFELANPKESGAPSFHIGTLPRFDPVVHNQMYYKLTLQNQEIQFETLTDKSSIALTQMALDLDLIPNKFGVRLRDQRYMYLLKCEAKEKRRSLKYLFRS